MPKYINIEAKTVEEAKNKARAKGYVPGYAYKLKTVYKIMVKPKKK